MSNLYQHPHGTLLLFKAQRIGLQFLRHDSQFHKEQISHVAMHNKFVFLATRSNKLYQLDVEKNNLELIPQFNNLQISHLVASDMLCMVIVQNRYIYTSGNNYAGTMGMGDVNQHKGFQLVPFFANGTHYIEHAAVGYCHVIVTEPMGNSWAWGENQYSSL